MLARRWCVPLLAKDVIKEPLLDLLGAPDAVASRRLSDISFAVVFAQTRELVAAGVSAILEGNFRAAEHARPLGELLGAATCAQVLCHADEPERIRRLRARAEDHARHAGHRDAEQAREVSPGAEYLKVPGERFRFSGTESADFPELLGALDRWWCADGL